MQIDSMQSGGGTCTAKPTKATIASRPFLISFSSMLGLVMPTGSKGNWFTTPLCTHVARLVLAVDFRFGADWCAHGVNGAAAQ